jgi:hypothetical protein
MHKLKFFSPHKHRLYFVASFSSSSSYQSHNLQNSVHFVSSKHTTSNTMEQYAKSVSVSDYSFAPSNSPTYLSPTAALPTPPQTFVESSSTILCHSTFMFGFQLEKEILCHSITATNWSMVVKAHRQ